MISGVISELDAVPQTQATADASSPFCPFSNRLDAILHVLCNTDPTVTCRHVKAFLWALRPAGVKDVPSYNHVCSLRNLVPMPVIKSAKCIGGRAGLFYFLPVSESIKLFTMDPSVYPHLTTLPRRAGDAVHDFIDTPRARELFESFRVANINHGGFRLAILYTFVGVMESAHRTSCDVSTCTRPISEPEPNYPDCYSQLPS